MAQPKQYKGFFPATESLKAQPEAIFSLYTPGNGKPLNIASNVEYELYYDGVLAGIGGLRCTQGEAYIDTWTQCAHASEIRVRLHWINPALPARDLPLYRSVFAEAFCVDADAGTQPRAWRAVVETGVEFAIRMCSQLARQNVIKSDTVTPVMMKQVDVSQWNLIPLPVELLVMNVVDVRHVTDGSVLPRRGGPPAKGGGRGGRGGGASGSQKGGKPQVEDEEELGPRDEKYTTKGGRDVTDLITKSEVIVRYSTYDMHSIGNSKIIITENPVADLVIVYSEVEDFNTIWATPNRKKVRMADAVEAKTGGAPFGYRGCRYIHLVSATGDLSAVKFTAIRGNYPFKWRLKEEEIAGDELLRACRVNLLACVDGGVVDTCWRERVQWVGDLRMSSKAIRSMTDDTKVVPFALHQIADSYDPSVGLVQGSWPCRTPKYELRMPLYHLAFCLTAIEHDPTLSFDPRVKKVVEDSIAFWKKNYLKNGFIVGTPGWMFTDWDFKNEEVSCRNQQALSNKPHAAWWYEVCTALKQESGINLKAYDNLFKSTRGYSLYPSGKPNIHATASVICSGITKSDNCSEFLLTEKWNGNSFYCIHEKIFQQVTAYYAYFIAAAFAKYNNDKACIRFINDFYLPIAKQHGSIYEKTNGSASMAHSWSIGFVELYIKFKNTPP